MSFASASLVIREDSFSFQVTSPMDPFFFVRVTEFNEKGMVFSDFNIHSVDIETTMRMLGLVRKRFDGPTHDMTLQFLDIFPKSREAVGNVSDKRNLTLRHDQVVKAIRDFGVLSGFDVKNSYLDNKRGKFSTIIET